MCICKFISSHTYVVLRPTNPFLFMKTVICINLLGNFFYLYRLFPARLCHYSVYDCDCFLYPTFIKVVEMRGITVFCFFFLTYNPSVFVFWQLPSRLFLLIWQKGETSIFSTCAVSIFSTCAVSRYYQWLSIAVSSLDRVSVVIYLARPVLTRGLECQVFKGKSGATRSVSLKWTRKIDTIV